MVTFSAKYSCFIFIQLYIDLFKITDLEKEYIVVSKKTKLF